MPRFLTGTGWLIAGVGGGVVSLKRPDDPDDAPLHVLASNAGGGVALDDHRFLYQHGATLETFDTRTAEIAVVDPEGANELEAGGGVYAAKFTNVVRVVREGQVERFPAHGVGAVGQDGAVFLYTPDNTYEGRALRDMQGLGGRRWSALEGYRPVCAAEVRAAVVVPGNIYGFRRAGDFCVYQAEVGARVIVQYVDRPFGLVLAVTEAAFRPDITLLPNGLVRVTFATTLGEAPETVRVFTVDPVQAFRALVAITPTPPPVPVPTPVPPPKPEPPPMSTPNRLDIVLAVDRESPHLLQTNTIDSCGEFTERVALRLNADDPNWGLLSKQPGEKQVRGHGIDAVIYKATQQVIDIIGGAGAKSEGENRNGSAGWNEVPKRAGNDWMPPLAVGGGTPPVVVPPAPSVDLSAVLAELKALRERIESMEQEIEGSDKALVLALRRVSMLEQKPAPSYRVVGSTSRTLGHSHSLNVTLEPKE